MHRILLTPAVVALVAPSWTGSLTDPPSSLRPSKAPAEVRFVHQHRRTLACPSRSVEGKTVCEPRTEEARGGTTLVLQPVDRGGSLIEGDERKATTVEFDNERGPQEKTVELRAGAWATSWAEGSTRFVAGTGEKLSIRLTTTTGICAVVKGECVLQAGKRKRTIEIPEANRPPER